MHNSCATKGMQSRRASINYECSGTSTGGCRAKGSPRMRSIRRQLSDSYVREKNGKLRKGDTAALARMLGMLRAGQTEVPSSPPTACQTVLQQFQHYLRQEPG